jgi:site-specific recombinase XerD
MCFWRFSGRRAFWTSLQVIEAFKLARLKAGTARATINRNLAVFGRMMNLAFRRRLIPQNPFDEIEFLAERPFLRLPHILTFDEEARVLAVASPAAARSGCSSRLASAWGEKRSLLSGMTSI